MLKLLLVIGMACTTIAMSSNVIQLTSENFVQLTNSTELLFIFFSASWCTFSVRAAPEVEKLATDIEKDPSMSGRVLIVKVNADTQAQLLKKFKVKKFPTFKIIHQGLIRKEFRGDRTAGSFFAYIQSHLSEAYRTLTHPREISLFDNNLPAIIYYNTEDSLPTPKEASFKTLATIYKEQCVFIYIKAYNSKKYQNIYGIDSIVHRPNKHEKTDDIDTFTESIENLPYWVAKKCDPLVKEITFQNAEELLDEGKPLLILFRKANDEKSIDLYVESIKDEIENFRDEIMFLTANGQVFSFPLNHLGLTLDDLPVIVLDSLEHLYKFKNFEDLSDHGKLNEFINDFFDGTLHKKYHLNELPPTLIDNPNAEEKSEIYSEELEAFPVLTTSVPQSVFKNLAPSGHRYSFKRDEF